MTTYTPQSTIDQRLALARSLMGGAMQGQQSTSSMAPISNLLMGFGGGFMGGQANRATQTNQDLRQQALAGMPTGDPAALAQHLLGQQDPELQGLGVKALMSQPSDLDRRYKEAQIAELSRGGKPPASYQEYQLAQADPNYAKHLTAGKPPTDSQSKTATFVKRINTSHKIITDQEKVLKNNPGQAGADLALGDWANPLLGADMQQMNQAQRDFVNAVLRRESGAVISPSEFDNARKQYFPQIGDTPEVIKQKRQNRITVLEGMGQEAGPQFEAPELYDPQEAAAPTDGSTPPPPPALASMQLQWNPTMQLFRDKATGTLYNKNGEPVASQ